jgi:hypothetical protein
MMLLSFALVSLAVGTGVVSAREAKAAKAATSLFDPCTCPYKEYRVNDVRQDFLSHMIDAMQQEGCQLATAGDAAERDIILAALVSANLGTTGNSRGFPWAWIGGARPLNDENAPFFWLDKCVPFDTSFFNSFEPNNVFNEIPGEFGVSMVYEAFDVYTVGELADLGGEDVLPAVYECCIEKPSKASKSPSKSPTSSGHRRRLA